MQLITINIFHITARKSVLYRPSLLCHWTKQMNPKIYFIPFLILLLLSCSEDKKVTQVDPMQNQPQQNEDNIDSVFTSKDTPSSNDEKLSKTDSFFREDEGSKASASNQKIITSSNTASDELSKTVPVLRKSEDNKASISNQKNNSSSKIASDEFSKTNPELRQSEENKASISSQNNSSSSNTNTASDELSKTNPELRQIEDNKASISNQKNATTSKIDIDEFLKIDPDFKWFPNNPDPIVEFSDNKLTLFYKNGTSANIYKKTGLSGKPVLSKFELRNFSQPSQTIYFSEEGLPISVTIAGVKLNYDWKLTDEKYEFMGISHPSKPRISQSHELKRIKTSSWFNFFEISPNSYSIENMLPHLLGVGSVMAEGNSEECNPGWEPINKFCDFKGHINFIGIFAAAQLPKLKAQTRAVSLALSLELGIAGHAVGQAHLAAVSSVFVKVLLVIPTFCASYSYAKKNDNELGCPLQAVLFGEPHIVTLDGLQYSFQVAGDFVLAKNDNGSIVIQGRFVHRNNTTQSVSVNRSTAVKIYDNIISTYKSNSIIYVNGKKIDDNIKHYNLSNDVILSLGKNNSVTLVSRDGTKVEIENTRVSLKTTSKGRFSGLYGDGDGNPSNDLRTADGRALSPEITLYGEYAKSWQVKPEDSLFIPGIDDFSSQLVAPKKVLKLSNFSQKAISRAQQTCRDNGINSQGIIDACAFDILVTGSTEFVVDARKAIAPKLVDPLNSVLGSIIKQAYDISVIEKTNLFIDSYRDYKSFENKKAYILAIDDDNWTAGWSFGWNDQSTANNEALRECNKRRKGNKIKSNCKLYAIGDEIVWGKSKAKISSIKIKDVKDVCMSFSKSCIDCTSQTGCGFCSTTNNCTNLTNKNKCEGELSSRQSSCPSGCRRHLDCNSCARDGFCGWNTENKACVNDSRRYSKQLKLVTSSDRCN